jgi:hypothetical protein
MFSPDLRSNFLKCFTDNFFLFITLPISADSSAIFASLTAFLSFVCSYFPARKDFPRSESLNFFIFNVRKLDLLYEVIVTFRTSHRNDFAFERTLHHVSSPFKLVMVRGHIDLPSLQPKQGYRKLPIKSHSVR